MIIFVCVVVVMIRVALVVNLSTSYSSEYYKLEHFTKSQPVNNINQVVNNLLRDLLPKTIVDKVQETPDSQPTIWSFPKISVLFVHVTNLAAVADDENPEQLLDRKSVVKGKSVSVRVDLGGRRIIKKKNKYNKHED